MNAPDISMIKAQMKAIWMAGDFGQIARYTEPTAEAFIKRRNIKEGMRVLDAACGTGNAAIPAAKTRRLRHRRGHRPQPLGGGARSRQARGT